MVDRQQQIPISEGQNITKIFEGMMAEMPMDVLKEIDEFEKFGDEKSQFVLCSEDMNFHLSELFNDFVEFVKLADVHHKESKNIGYGPGGYTVTKFARGEAQWFVSEGAIAVVATPKKWMMLYLIDRFQESYTE